jgi:hypothetical protein
MCVACTTEKEHFNKKSFNHWKAAFVEDTVTLHLHKKKIFSNLVYKDIEDTEVRPILEDDPNFGRAKVEKIKNDLNEIINKNNPSKQPKQLNKRHVSLTICITLLFLGSIIYFWPIRI